MKDFREVQNKALEIDIKPKLVVPCPYDKNILTALDMVQKNNVANIILIGNKSKIDEILDYNKIDFEYEDFIQIKDEVKAIEKAYSLIVNDKVDIIMKGIVQTKDFMAVLLSNKEFIKRKLLTHIAIYELPKLNKLLFVSDPSIIIEPTIEQKEIIIENALDLLDCMDIRYPKVAIVSSTETVNKKVRSSVDAISITQKYANSDKNAIIYGPLAIDNAISAEAANLKKINSAVAGNADLLIMPSLDAGNIFCKGLTYIGKLESAGIVMGATKPIVLTSRSASPKEKFNSILVACIISNNLQKHKGVKV